MAETKVWADAVGAWLGYVWAIAADLASAARAIVPTVTALPPAATVATGVPTAVSAVAVRKYLPALDESSRVRFAEPDASFALPQLAHLPHELAIAAVSRSATPPPSRGWLANS